MPTKKITLLGLFTAIALITFIIEAQLPPIAPIPGVKLGISNVVTLFAIFWLSRKDALCILLLRIFLGSIFSGHLVTLFYSLSGGLLSFAIIALFYKTFSLKCIWIPSIISAIFHNIGQILCAILLTDSLAIAAYLPVLILTGSITGLFTGLIVQLIITRHTLFQNPYSYQ